MVIGKQNQSIGKLQMTIITFRNSNKSTFFRKSTEFLAWLFNESPSKDYVVTNDRWGQGTGKKHGSFFSGPDRW